MSNYHGHQARAFVSQEEMQLWMSDPRYKGSYTEREESFINHVVACIDLTPTNTVGVGVGANLVDSMGVSPSLKFQDPLNTLGAMSDVYRDMEEARLDQGSHLYKTSAFERERVARKIDRSVPDSVVMPDSKMYAGSFQATGNAEADWGGEE